MGRLECVENDGTYKNEKLVIKKSFWGSISIFWRLVTLAVAVVLLLLDAVVPVVCGAVILTLWVVSFLYKAIYNGKNNYEIVETCGCEPTKVTMIINTVCPFYRRKEYRRFTIEASAFVEYRPTFKGRMFAFCTLGIVRFGNLIVYSGIGEAGELVLQNVRNPKKLEKKIRKIVENGVSDSARYNLKPYVVYGVTDSNKKNYTRVV